LYFVFFKIQNTFTSYIKRKWDAFARLSKQANVHCLLTDIWDIRLVHKIIFLMAYLSSNGFNYLLWTDMYICI